MKKVLRDKELSNKIWIQNFYRKIRLPIILETLLFSKNKTKKQRRATTSSQKKKNSSKLKNYKNKKEKFLKKDKLSS